MSVNVFASNTIFGCFYFRYYHCTDTAIFPLRLSQFHIIDFQDSVYTCAKQRFRFPNSVPATFQSSCSHLKFQSSLRCTAPVSSSTLKWQYLTQDIPSNTTVTFSTTRRNIYKLRLTSLPRHSLLT